MVLAQCSVWVAGPPPLFRLCFSPLFSQVHLAVTRKKISRALLPHSPPPIIWTKRMGRSRGGGTKLRTCPPLGLRRRKEQGWRDNAPVIPPPHPPLGPRGWREQGGEGQGSRRGTFVPFDPPPFLIKGGTPGLTPDTAGKGSWKGTAGGGEGGGGNTPPMLNREESETAASGRRKGRPQERVRLWSQAVSFSGPPLS